MKNFVLALISIFALSSQAESGKTYVQFLNCTAEETESNYLVHITFEDMLKILAESGKGTPITIEGGVLEIHGKDVGHYIVTETVLVFSDGKITLENTQDLMGLNVHRYAELDGDMKGRMVSTAKDRKGKEEKLEEVINCSRKKEEFKK